MRHWQVKFVSRWAAVATTSLLVACGSKDRCGQHSCSEHVFEALVKVKVHTTRIHDFDRTINDFALTKGLIVNRAGFSTGNRAVANVEIDFTKDRKTFISFDNFRRPEVIEGAIYSHEDRGSWEVTWQAFLSTMRREFGDKNIDISQ